MTPEEARQKIIDRVLSLRTGWSLVSKDVFQCSQSEKYRHPLLPEEVAIISSRYLIMLREIYNIRLLVGENMVEAGDEFSPLGSLAAEIRKETSDAKKREMDDKIIKIAQSL